MRGYRISHTTTALLSIFLLLSVIAVATSFTDVLVPKEKPAERINFGRGSYQPPPPTGDSFFRDQK